MDKHFLQIMEELTRGFGTTLTLFAVTLVVALPFGLLIAFGAMSKFKPLKAVTKAFVWVIRGTPLMLQVFLVSFLPKYLFGVKVKEFAGFLGISINSVNFVFVAVAFAINYACYFSEIFRGGIQGISKGQYEAGKVLGLTKSQIFFKVVLLQVVKKTLAPISNEVITLVKDTALAQVLGVIDLLSAANHAVNSYVVLTPLVYAAVFYLLFNGLLTLLFAFAEKKLSFYKE